MAGPITFGGISSGIDTNSIITKLVQIEKRPIVDLQTRVTSAQTRQGLLGGLSTKVNDLQTSLRALTTQAGISGRAATVASGAPYTATAGPGSALGDYSVIVNQLAQAQRTYSNAFPDPAKAGLLKAGTLTLSTGGKSASITIGAGDNLNQVASQINGAGLSLTASVVYDGSEYRMVINGGSAGKQNAVTFADAGTGLALDVPANTVIPAKDARLSVDGLVVSSSSNNVTGIIPGIALSLTGTSGTAYTTSITNDPTKLQTSLEAVATAYNAVMGLVGKQMPQTGSSTPLDDTTLVGDSAVLQLQTTMFNLPVSTAGPKGNTFTALAEIGLTVDRYGTMSLDANRLQTVMATKGSAVIDLLVGTDGKNGLASKLANGVQAFTDPVSGVLVSDNQSIGQQITAMNKSIDRMSRMADAYQTNLQAQFSAMEQLISTYNSQTSSLTQMLNNTTSSSSSSSSSKSR